MDRQTRLSRMVQALRKLATSGQDGDFLIFADVKTEDYVQFMRVPFLGEGAEPGFRGHRRVRRYAPTSAIAMVEDITLA